LELKSGQEIFTQGGFYGLFASYFLSNQCFNVVRPHLAGLMVSYLIPLVFFLLQDPGHNWDPLLTPPREMGHVYWEQSGETKIWVRIVPVYPDHKSPLLDLIFNAYFPGAVDFSSGRPKKLKGPPARITLEAQPWPLVIIRELSLRIIIDGRKFDLTASDAQYKTIMPAACNNDAVGNCGANAVEAELTPSLLRSLISAQNVDGQALGFPIKLVAADQAALAKFAKRIGLLDAAQPKE
jgi:hypothetical protein